MNKKLKKYQETNEELEEYKTSYFKRMFYGFFMGISDGIPGYSGGTTLTLIGFYEKLIFKLKSFLTDFKRSWWRNILWLLPFLFFWIISLLLFSFVTNKIATAGYQYTLIIAFGLFAFLSIPTFVIVNKPDLIRIKNQKIFVQKANWKSIFLFITGFLIVLGIGIFIYFSGGISLEGNLNIDLKKPTINWLYIILSITLAAFVMLIPGISGSMILFLTSKYDDVYFGVLNDPLGNIGLLSLMGVGVVFGIIINILVSSVILRRWKNFYLSYCFGMVASSFITITLAGEPYLNLIGSINGLEIAIIVLITFFVIWINILLFSFCLNNRVYNNSKVFK